MTRKCQEPECDTRVEEPFVICTPCLKAKGQGRWGPPKPPPTFHVPGEKYVKVPEVQEQEVTAAPRQPWRDEEYGESPQERILRLMQRLGEVLADNQVDPSLGRDPIEALAVAMVDARAETRELQLTVENLRKRLYAANEQLREKTKGAPQRETPFAELEPTRFEADFARKSEARQADFKQALNDLIEAFLNLAEVNADVAKRLNAVVKGG